MIKFKIKHNTPNINKEHIDYLNKILKNNSILTNGPLLNLFEKKVKSFLKCNYSIACSSGTAALELAISSLKLRKNSTIIMPAINFVASYNICKKMNLKVYLADVDEETGQMKPNHVIECMRFNKLKKVNLIINMYMAGFPENVIEFAKLKKKLKCYLIEDACHAFGAEYFFKKKFLKIGSSVHSDICTFSFHPLKTITTGEGGLITTNKRYLAEKIKILRSHGIRKNKDYWNYDVISHGYNYRMSEINAALGLSQLKKISDFLKKRKILYEKYRNNLKKENIFFPTYNKKNKSSYHLMIGSINFKLKHLKNNFFKKLIKNKIEIHFHYKPIYKFKIFGKQKFFLKGCEKYYSQSFSIPLHTELRYKDINYVTDTIKKWLSENSNTIGKKLLK